MSKERDTTRRLGGGGEEGMRNSCVPSPPHPKRRDMRGSEGLLGRQIDANRWVEIPDSREIEFSSVVALKDGTIASPCTK